MHPLEVTVLRRRVAFLIVVPVSLHRYAPPVPTVSRRCDALLIVVPVSLHSMPVQCDGCALEELLEGFQGEGAG